MSFAGVLQEQVIELGGFHNAHLHLDRAGTYPLTQQLLAEDGVLDGSTLPLNKKHGIISLTHESRDFDMPEYRGRVQSYLHELIELGTRQVDTFVDVTNDRVQRNGLEAFLELKEHYKEQIHLRAGCYNPFGFSDSHPEAWDLITDSLNHADFLGLLPERDDQRRYPDHIGFNESCRRAILLSQQHNKELHVHIDQGNHPYENDTERFLDVLETCNLEPPTESPTIWLVHVISPSTLPEGNFQDLVKRLVRHNIGIISCPSGAISMRQLRPIHSPTFNSIARVLDFLAQGIPVRLGSDNVHDITMPMGTCDLMQEVFMLANAVRFYQPEVLSHLLAGRALPKHLQEAVQAHLHDNEQEIRNVQNFHKIESCD